MNQIYRVKAKSSSVWKRNFALWKVTRDHHNFSSEMLNKVLSGSLGDRESDKSLKSDC